MPGPKISLTEWLKRIFGKKIKKKAVRAKKARLKSQENSYLKRERSEEIKFALVFQAI